MTRKEGLMLKKIVFVTQGKSPQWSRTVLNSAKADIVRLSHRIAENLGDAKTRMLCADIKVPRVTASILSQNISLDEISYHRELNYFGEFGSGQLSPIFKLIEDAATKCDVVLICTLVELVDKLPTIIGKEYGFNIQESINTPPATARVIDMTTGEVTTLSGTDSESRAS